MSKVVRAILLWISGLLAFAIVGGAIGKRLDVFTGEFMGMVAGLALFTCLRLWLGERTDS